MTEIYPEYQGTISRKSGFVCLFFLSFSPDLTIRTQETLSAAHLLARHFLHPN